MTKEVTSPAFLNGGGTMGELIRSKDWSNTQIGTPDRWPNSLRTTVSIILNSQFPMFVWWGADLTAIYNDAYVTIAGEKHPHLLGKSGREAWSEIWPDLEPLVKSVFNGAATWSEDQPLYMNRRGYIEETYFTFSYSPILNDSGAVEGLFCACIETTEKVLAARKIQESERNLRNTILQSPVAMCILKGPSFVVEIANTRMFELWGRSADELLHRPIFDGLPEARHQGLEGLLQHVYSTGESFSANERPVILPRKEKADTVYINFVYEPFFDGEGTISAIIAVAIDVTEQVVSRKKVEENREELQMAVEIAELGAFEVNLQTNRASYTERIRQWFGLEELELDMDAVFMTIHPDDRLQIKKGIQDAIVNEENSRHDVTYRIVNKTENSVRHVRSIGRIFFDSEGKAFQVRGILQDVTPQILYRQKMEESEAKLQQRVAERTIELENANNELMRSNVNLEEFAYAASHDMKEPIRKIHFFSDRLKHGLKDKLDEEQTRLFNRMENAAQRMSSLIDDLLTYSHISKGVSHLETIDLNKKLQQVMQDLELEIEERGAKINADPLPVIHGHKRQIQQLFQNLLGNAIKYSKPGVAPEVQIRTRIVRGAETPKPLSGVEADKQFHLIEIIDNGIGFEQKDADRIFHVFTRLHGNAEYRGTGVGLSIARKVVENHNGYIWADSEPGKGSAFRILLPV
ncbi:MAG TPA: ATP-binding protein [Flavisolibacter sp.]